MCWRCCMCVCVMSADVKGSGRRRAGTLHSINKWWASLGDWWLSLSPPFSILLVLTLSHHQNSNVLCCNRTVFHGLTCHTETCNHHHRIQIWQHRSTIGSLWDSRWPSYCPVQFQASVSTATKYVGMTQARAMQLYLLLFIIIFFEEESQIF